ncbi:hypothetical protein CHELA1G11_14464 [Hyphomicrobiales bacterium]|nr:hypothetical protein CHELA1G11_14464 [Hyphomicrobiales bacterium]CAH1680093.1 hypothetical protein CHELA1G2_14646 [Hyphomicrobiales bacterium]
MASHATFVTHRPAVRPKLFQANNARQIRTSRHIEPMVGNVWYVRAIPPRGGFRNKMLDLGTRKGRGITHPDALPKDAASCWTAQL